MKPAKRNRIRIGRARHAAALALAALIYPLWLKREAVIALHPRLDAAKAGAEVAERVAQEIEKIASAHNFVMARKQGQQPAVALLEDLSRLLPDTTWVQQLDVKTNQKSREIQIAGETGSSSQLIEVLEQSGSLANAGFKSPLTKGVTPNTERFLLSAEIKPRALPDPIPETDLTKPGTAAIPAPSISTPGSLPAAPPPSSLPAQPAPSAAQPAPGAGPGAGTAPPATGGAPSAKPAAGPAPAVVPAKKG